MHYDIVVIGLSLSSSWGNGHATTYRALLRGLAERGQKVLFLERDVPWYSEHRDLPAPGFCDLALYASLDDLRRRFSATVARSGAVIVGSYVPEGVAVLDWVLSTSAGVRGFYDIDTPVTLAKLEAGCNDYLAVRQIPMLDLYFSFTAGPTLERLATRYGARRPRALYCAVDDTRYLPTHSPIRWDLGYLGTYSPDRQPALQRLLIEPANLLPEHRFVVAGPQYPADIEWPANVDRIDHLPPDRHPEFYGAQRFTLNVTRADMIEAGWSPSVRLFEAAACRTPIISDRWAGLTNLLPETDAIVIADDTATVVGTLTSPDRARYQHMADRALTIVKSCHTGLARAGSLEREIASVTRMTARHTFQVTSSG